MLRSRRSQPLPRRAVVDTLPASGSRPSLEWRLPLDGAGELVFGERLLRAVEHALKCYHRSPRLATGPLAGLHVVARCKAERRIADDALGAAFAVRAVLHQALARLAAADAEAAALLEARFVHARPIAHFESHGYARATLLRRSRRALETLAWELWSLELEARQAAPGA